MKLLQLCVFVLVFAFAQLAGAARPNYTYLGLAYTYDRLDPNCKQDGVFLEGSLVVSELSFIRVQHTDVTSNSWCGSTTTSVAGGVRSDVGGSSSVYATAALVRRDYGVDAELGIAVDAGVRSVIMPNLEATGFVGYEAIDDFETTYFGGGVNYWLSRRITLTGAVTLNDSDDEGLKLGLRYNF